VEKLVARVDLPPPDLARKAIGELKKLVTDYRKESVASDKA